MTAPRLTPPLRQSIYSQMACEHGYALVHIEGKVPPDTAESDRGTDVHDILAAYTTHCALQGVPADFPYIDDQIIRGGLGEEAAAVLETCKESLTIDYRNFFAAELSMGLDADFQPTWSYDHDGHRVELSPLWGIEGSGNEPEYCGIHDAIYLLPGETVAIEDDYKTHPRAFKATTFQAKLYALMLMMHQPKLQQVTFRLRFVRYANKVEAATYCRADVPQMMDDVRQVRARQLVIHDKYQGGANLRVHAGAHCIYCPAITNYSCPIAEYNPMTNLTPADRLNFRLWYDAASRVNNKAMAEYVDGTGGSIHSVDSNGKAYSFGKVEKVKTTYPLFVDNGDGSVALPIADQILTWALDPELETAKAPREGSRPWYLNLRIGSTELKPYLKAKSRVHLHQAITDLAETRIVTENRITRDAEVDDGEGEEHRDYQEGQ